MYPFHTRYQVGLYEGPVGGVISKYMFTRLSRCRKPTVSPSGQVGARNTLISRVTRPRPAVGSWYSSEYGGNGLNANPASARALRFRKSRLVICFDTGKNCNEMILCRQGKIDVIIRNLGNINFLACCFWRY